MAEKMRVHTMGSSWASGAWDRYTAGQALLVLVIPAVVLGGLGVLLAILMQ